MNFPLKEISSDVGLALVVIYLVIKELVRGFKRDDSGSVTSALNAFSHLINAQTLALEKILLGQDAIRRQLEGLNNKKD